MAGGTKRWLAQVPVSYTHLDVYKRQDQRCTLCHNAAVQQKNVALHTPDLIRQHAQNVYQQVAVLKVMPLNNATQMSDAERALIRRWFEAGAPAN